MYYKLKITNSDIVCKNIRIEKDMLEFDEPYYMTGSPRNRDCAHISNINSMNIIAKEVYDQVINLEIKVQLGIFTAVVSKDCVKLEGTNYRHIKFPLESISALQNAVETIVFNQKK